MTHSYQWSADSTEPDVRSGVATFKIGVKIVVLHLPSFEEAQRLSDALFHYSNAERAAAKQTLLNQINSL